ncbi:uncharacterized protein LOC111026963, partial [Myzus persicae]|uniref:uncharacterized protein LOC111026963 n=1 Tax=Myzus persicae TaxID=13164 RepID=UPI000B92FE12
KTVLNYLAYLKTEVTRISDKQQNIEQMLLDIKSSSKISRSAQDEFIYNNNEVDYFISSWPILDNEGLNNLEDKIQTDMNFKKQVVCELARIGGKSLKNIIYKIMQNVFDDRLLMQYTYYGLRNKNNFSLLSINKLIFDAVKKSKYNASNDDEIITSIAKWLTSAKGRIEGK